MVSKKPQKNKEHVEKSFKWPGCVRSFTRYTRKPFTGQKKYNSLALQELMT